MFLITFNIGGKLFTAHKENVLKYPDSYLTMLVRSDGLFTVDKDDHGYIYIDRDHKYVDIIFDIYEGKYNKSYSISPELTDELNFYGMWKLYDRAAIKQIIKSGSFYELFNYELYDLQDMSRSDDNGTLLVNLLVQCKNLIIIKYVFNNIIDLESKDIVQQGLIHFVCRDSTADIIKYVLNLKINKYRRTVHGTLPQQLLQYNDILTDKEKNELLTLF
jgi:hypothetical protein